MASAPCGTVCVSRFQLIVGFDSGDIRSFKICLKKCWFLGDARLIAVTRLRGNLRKKRMLILKMTLMVS